MKLPCAWAYYFAVIGVSICRASDEIIQIGDSFASFSGKSLATFCSGKSVDNQGIGGTTTSDWGTGTIRDALEGKEYDQIMLAIGGNDFLKSGCTLNKDKLKQRVASTIDRIVSVAKPTKDIVLLGYCKPTPDFDICSISSIDVLNEALALAVVGKKAVYVNTDGACGGGSPRYMVDAIHPNNRGYCTLYQNEMTQKAFGCECQEKLDCSQVSATVPRSLHDLGLRQSTACVTNEPTPTVVNPPTPTETTPPVNLCADNTKMKFKIDKKKLKCSKLKPKHCKRRDKKNGNLVLNYCLQLCNNCDLAKRCQDDTKVKFIQKETKDKFKCVDLSEEHCNERDAKKRLVSQYCRNLCGFCDSEAISGN